MPHIHVNTARFSRDDRLTTPAEFERVFKDPVKTTSRHFTILACPNGTEHARLGLAIAKKTIRFAVQRNRLKRVVRESFRQHKNQLGQIDIVVLSRKGADQESRATLRDTLLQHWNQLAEKCAR